MNEPQDSTRVDEKVDETEVGQAPTSIERAETTPAAEGQSSAARRPVKVKSTRFSALWTSVIVAALLLVLLLIFIVQNNNSVEINFLGLSGHLPLGVAMLGAAIAGILLVAIPGYGRILQLRRAVRKAGKR